MVVPCVWDGGKEGRREVRGGSVDGSAVCVEWREGGREVRGGSVDGSAVRAVITCDHSSWWMGQCVKVGPHFGI